MAKNKYTKENLSAAAKECTSIVQMLTYFGLPLSGGSHAHLGKRIRDFGVDISHFPGSAHGRGKSMPQKDHTQILVARDASENRSKSHMLRRAMKQIGIKEICESCGVGDTWMGFQMTLEIDHKDGNSRNDQAENLRFLCPNCHSVTPTYKNKKRG